jgi:hypothetical protein
VVVDRTAKKISLEPDKPTAQLAAEIHDGIRYTFTFPADNYTLRVYEAEGKLRGRGYERSAQTELGRQRVQRRERQME